MQVTNGEAVASLKESETKPVGEVRPRPAVNRQVLDSLVRSDYLHNVMATSSHLRRINERKIVHSMLRLHSSASRTRLAEILGMSQPKISRHLAYLRRAGIVTARRDGKWMHYRLAIPRDPAAAAVLQETVKNLARKPEMQRDIARLSSACCQPQRFELLQGAPQPQAVGQALRLPTVCKG